LIWLPVQLSLNAIEKFLFILVSFVFIVNSYGGYFQTPKFLSKYIKLLTSSKVLGKACSFVNKSGKCARLISTFSMP
jgi:hypothetical protein